MMVDIILASVIERHRREDGIISAYVDSVESIGGGDHLLMKLFAGTDTHLNLWEVGSDGCGYILDMIRGDLGDKDFAAEMMFDSPEHEIDAGLERDIETSHPHISDRQLLGPGIATADEEWDYTATRAHDISISHDAEFHGVITLDIVGGSEELIAGELGSAIKIDGCASLVGGKSHDMLHTSGECCIDHILSAMNIGLDTLLGVVLGSVDLLDGGGMDYDIDALASANQTLAVAHIADKESQLRILIVRILLLEFELLEFIARIYDNSLHIGITAEDHLHELLTKRAGATRDQNRLIIKHIA